MIILVVLSLDSGVGKDTKWAVYSIYTGMIFDDGNTEKN